MREIKFRIWDKNNAKFISRWERVFINAWECCVYTKSELEKRNFSYMNDLPEIEVNQFTGLKDCKEREIYENDIVKTKIGVMDFVLKVVFENGKFMAVGDDDDLTAFDLFTIADKCEVIGNIYENTGLLKG